MTTTAKAEDQSHKQTTNETSLQLLHVLHSAIRALNLLLHITLDGKNET